MWPRVFVQDDQFSTTAASRSPKVRGRANDAGIRVDLALSRADHGLVEPTARHAASRARRAPWNWQVPGKIDLIGQSRWYQAALNAFEARSWMKGLFLWQWDIDPNVAAPRTTATRRIASRPRACCGTGASTCRARRLDGRRAHRPSPHFDGEDARTVL
jgi:hypothetical protein